MMPWITCEWVHESCHKSCVKVDESCQESHVNGSYETDRVRKMIHVNQVWNKCRNKTFARHGRNTCPKSQWLNHVNQSGHVGITFACLASRDAKHANVTPTCPNRISQMPRWAANHVTDLEFIRQTNFWWQRSWVGERERMRARAREKKRERTLSKAV